jgi:glycosyltransferase involved in cell wall biosynthesis
LSHFSDFVARQRDGILAAEAVCYGQRGLVPAGDRLLDEIGVQDCRRLMLHFSNTVDLQPKPAPQNPLLTVLCGSRIVFRPEHNPAMSAMDFKGTDVLVKGFALFLRGGGQGELRLPRKGQDLEAALSLTADLGIENSIHWLNEMPLAQFYEEMAAADLICDQFGTSFPGMVTTDAYALGRPVMANLRNEIFEQRFFEPLPGFNAKTPEQICSHLNRIEGDRSLLLKIGEKSRSYAERFLSPKTMAEQLIMRLRG